MNDTKKKFLKAVVALLAIATLYGIGKMPGMVPALADDSLWEVLDDDHTHTWKTEVKKASFTADGSIDEVCTECGEVRSSERIAKIQSISLSKTSYTYTGEVRTPTVTLKDSNGKIISSSCYKVSYPSGRKNAGTYKVKVTMQGKYTGTKDVSFKIRSGVSIKLSQTTYTYNGKVKKPSVIVTDSSGKKVSSSYYKVSYASGRKKVGVYRVKVTMKGKYTGSKMLYFKILPAKNKISSLKQSGLKNRFQIKYTKKSGVSGYQIQYSRTKSFGAGVKTKKVVGSGKTSRTITGLTPGATYYVRVRSYQKVKKYGRTYTLYSAWSSKKKIELNCTAEDYYLYSDKPQLCYEMLDLVNAERKKRGLKPMTWKEDLEKGALIRAKELVQNYSHTRPNGKDASSAWSYRGGAYNEIAADATGAWLNLEPRDVLDAWMRSPGHRGVVILRTERPNEVAESHLEFANGVIFEPGDVIPGNHWDNVMCCAFCDGYWVMVVDIENEVKNSIN